MTAKSCAGPGETGLDQEKQAHAMRIVEGKWASPLWTSGVGCDKLLHTLALRALYIGIMENKMETTIV